MAGAIAGLPCTGQTGTPGVALLEYLNTPQYSPVSVGHNRTASAACTPPPPHQGNKTAAQNTACHLHPNHPTGTCV